MSLMKSLARVAAGVLVAKGIGTVMRNAQSGGSRQTSGQSSGRSGGSFLDEILGNNTRPGATGGGWSDKIGQILGGNQTSQAGSGKPYGGRYSRDGSGAQGGIGGMLDGLGRSNVPQSGGGQSGGLGGSLGSIAAGGIGGVLGGLLGGRAQAGSPQAEAAGTAMAERGSQPQNDASFGEVLNDSLTTGEEPSVAPTPEQNAVAALLLSAMIQAAKADGKIDDAEKQRLMGQVGDLDAEEQAFIREQMAAPVDPAAIARATPGGLEQQVYLMSLMAIDLDTEEEARYMHALADGLKLSQPQVNAIHQRLGVKDLYA